jgi:hypothetical protein
MQFSDAVVQAVWEKARGMTDRDPTEWRQDRCGAWLHRHQYGNVNSEYGWKIENIVAGGMDEVDNLQPFHWNNGFDIANGRPRCRVSADRAGLAPGQLVDVPRNSGV